MEEHCSLLEEILVDNGREEDLVGVLILHIRIPSHWLQMISPLIDHLLEVAIGGLVVFGHEEQARGGEKPLRGQARPHQVDQLLRRQAEMGWGSVEGVASQEGKVVERGREIGVLHRHQRLRSTRLRCSRYHLGHGGGAARMDFFRLGFVDGATVSCARER